LTLRKPVDNKARILLVRDNKCELEAGANKQDQHNKERKASSIQARVISVEGGRGVEEENGVGIETKGRARNGEPISFMKMLIVVGYFYVYVFALCLCICLWYVMLICFIVC
jgi:hypothetical protein